MTEREFFNWIDGFSTACHNLGPTPEQWNTIIEKIKEIKETPVQKNYILGNTTSNWTTTPNYGITYTGAQNKIENTNE